jgi:hypothetical protein
MTALLGVLNWSESVMTDAAAQVSAFPTYADWLAEFAKGCSHPFARDSADGIKLCLEFEQKVPKDYGWKFSTAEALLKEFRGTKNPSDVNRAYWLDFARNCEAYSVMTFWRGLELIKPAIRSLNIREVIAPAVLSRSLLELSAVSLWNANILDENIGKVLAQAREKPDFVVASTELENFMAKAIWGTRLGDPRPEIKQTNVLTIIDKITKNPAASELMTKYEYLCEIAHPNVIGNATFWSHVDKKYPNGSELRIISKSPNVESIRDTLENILWALGWGAAVVRNSLELRSQAIGRLVTHFGP